MKTVRLDVPFSLREIGQGALDLLRANEFRQDAHFIPVAFFGMGAHNFNTLGPTVDNGVYITAVAWPQPSVLWDGATACVVSWRRISDDTMPPRLKAGANYQNSRLAQTEAKVDGYDTAIILNQRGTVAEGPGACLMMVRDGKLITPPVTAGILESITRTTLMELAGASWAWRWWSGKSTAPSSTWPTRCSSAAAASRCSRSPRSTGSRSARELAGR